MHSSSEKYEGIALAFSEMMPKSKQHYTRSKNEYVLPSDGGPDAILTQSPFNSGILNAPKPAAEPETIDIFPCVVVEEPKPDLDWVVVDGDGNVTNGTDTNVITPNETDANGMASYLMNMTYQIGSTTYKLISDANTPHARAYVRNILEMVVDPANWFYPQ